MNEIVSTMDVDHLLKRKWVILSGGRTTSGSYLISLPDAEQSMDDSLAKILKFFYDIIINVDGNANFVLVIDRRKNKWPNVKPFLNFVQDNFPDKLRIEKIYFLQPSGVFSSLFKLFSNTDDAKIEFLTSTFDLHKKLEKSQLSREFDGLIDFKIDEWLKDKETVNQIEADIKGVERDLDVLILKLQDSMSFDEVSRKSSLEMNERGKKYEVEFLALYDKVLECQSNVKANQKYYLDSLPLNGVHKQCLDRLEPRVEAAKEKYQEFRKKYESFIEKASKSLLLIQQVNEVISSAETKLNEISLVDVIGCKSLDDVHLSANLVKNIENDIESLKQESESLYLAVENLRAIEMSSTSSSDHPMNGDDFSTSVTTIESSVGGDIPSFTDDVSVIQQLNKRLGDQTSKMISFVADLKNKLQLSFQQLNKTHDAISAMDKALEWSKEAEKLICHWSPLIDVAKTADECQTAVVELKTFQKTLESVDYKDISSLRLDFSEVLGDFMLETVQKNYSKFSAMQERINELIESLSLKEFGLRESEWIEQIRLQQSSAAEISSLKDSEDSRSIDSLELPPSDDPELVAFKKESHSIPMTKTRKFPQAKIVVDSKIIPGMMMMNDRNICQRLDIINASRNQFSPYKDVEPMDSNQQFHLIDIRQNNSAPDDMEKYIPPRLREDLIGIQPVPDSGTIRRKRSHVIQELIETERAYTSDLKNIIEGYYDQFENKELQELIPKELTDKRDTLFGNIKDIHYFHSMVFLKSLEACECRMCDVGKCFIENKERFQLYSEYCQNKIKAEILIEKVGGNNPFFRECQRRLNHSLPFSSYILKPVQRITKYHLLLKELVRMTTNQSEAIDLKKAIMAISDVLRYVNNSMHQLSITGFPGNLMEQGRLLMQGSLEVSVEKRKDRGSSIKQTFHKRQVFLYDRCMLFCKKKEASTGLGSYVFKSMLKTDEVGPLVESPKGGDERRFELWSKNDIWSFVTPTLDEKLDWVEEIKKVLYEQMDYLRATNKKLHNDFVSQKSACPAMCPMEPDSLISSDLDNCSDT